MLQVAAEKIMQAYSKVITNVPEMDDETLLPYFQQLVLLTCRRIERRKGEKIAK